MRKLARILALVLVAATTFIALGSVTGEFRDTGPGLLRQSVAFAVATFAYSDPIDNGVILGGLAAGMSCVLMGWWVVWAARESVRPHIPATSDSLSSSR